MVRRVIWSANAKKERQEILTYWTQRNKSKVYSKKLYQLFADAIDLISRNAKIGKLTSKENVRIKIVSDYLVIYRTEIDRLIVLSIIDGRRDPEEFKKRL